MKHSYTKYLDKDSLILSNSTTKAAAFKEISERAAMFCNLEAEAILRLINQREQMMTTGVGCGLGLPHIRTKGKMKPIVIALVAKEPITDYESQDGKNVRVLMFLMASDEDQNAYLQLLGSISRRLRHPDRVQEVIDNITRPSVILRILKKRPISE